MTDVFINEQQRGDVEYITNALREKGIDLDATFLHYDNDLGTWRLFIVSPDLDRKDPRSVLKEIRDVFKSANGSVSLKFFNTEVKSPNSPEIIYLFSRLRLGGIVNKFTMMDIFFGDAGLSGIYIEHANIPKLIREVNQNNRYASNSPIDHAE